MAEQVGKPIIELGPKDAAIVLKDDGTYDLYLPMQSDGDIAHPASVTAAKLIVCLETPEVGEWADKKLASLQAIPDGEQFQSPAGAIASLYEEKKS